MEYQSDEWIWDAEITETGPGLVVGGYERSTNASPPTFESLPSDNELVQAKNLGALPSGGSYDVPLYNQQGNSSGVMHFNWYFQYAVFNPSNKSFTWKNFAYSYANGGADSGTRSVQWSGSIFTTLKLKSYNLIIGGAGVKSEPYVLDGMT